MSKRGGFIAGWTDSANCRVHLDHQREKATVASAQQNWKGARDGVDPAVRRLAELLEPHAGYLPRIFKRAGVERSTVVKWIRCGKDPKLSYFRATLNALGYDLKVVRRRHAIDDDEMPGDAREDAGDDRG
jgi:hypothetical protein